MLANKDNTCSSLYMYSLLCVFISQYTNKVDFIPMGEAQMGEITKLATMAPYLPMESPLLQTESQNHLCSL